MKNHTARGYRASLIDMMGSNAYEQQQADEIARGILDHVFSEAPTWDFYIRQCQQCGITMFTKDENAEICDICAEKNNTWYLSEKDMEDFFRFD